MTQLDDANPDSLGPAMAPGSLGIPNIQGTQFRARERKPRVERWTITLEPLPDDVPVGVRMRLLLKTALRRLRLKCVGISGERQATDGSGQHQ